MSVHRKTSKVRRKHVKLPGDDIPENPITPTKDPPAQALNFPEATRIREPRISGWSILSVVFAFLIPPLGLIFGIVALVKIKKDPVLTGRGLAIFGIIISILWPIAAFMLLFTHMIKAFLL